MIADHHPIVRAERAKVGAAIAFILAGIAFATWAGRIPDIRRTLELTPGQLGVVLLTGSCGSLVGLPLAGWVASRVGTSTTVRIGAILYVAGIASVGFAAGIVHDPYLTAAALFVALAGIGQWDVAMNLEGSRAEHVLGRDIMPRFHAGFSIGTVIGALIGVGVVAADVNVAMHFTSVGVALVLIAFWATRRFLSHETHIVDIPQHSSGAGISAENPSLLSAWREPRTLAIGIVMLAAAFTEGAANDWISLAFVDGHGAPGWAGVLALSVFLLFMTTGRMVGAAMFARWGRVPVVGVLFIAAAIGSLMVVFGTSAIAYLGAAVWGFGVSLGFPVGISAASDDPYRAAARVSVVSTMAYAAFLAGPPTLGFLGDQWGILRALSVISVLILVALVALPAIRESGPRYVNRSR